MRSLRMLAIAILLPAAIAGAQTTRPITLKVGDLPPPLAGQIWLKGEPIKSFERGKIYVIEMWATWCGSCIATFPDVSRVQAEYGKDGVVIIGQSVQETDQAAVEPFVRTMGDRMGYRVVIDDVSRGGKGTMAETWLEAAGEHGIPCAFVIGRDGRLAWIGNISAIEPVLRQLIAGTFDAERTAIADAPWKQFQREFTDALVSKQWDRALTLIDEHLICSG